MKEQTLAFCQGFYDLIRIDEIRIFTPAELDLTICGFRTLMSESCADTGQFSRHISRNTLLLRCSPMSSKNGTTVKGRPC
jgi:hypothetical protein